MTTKLLFHIPEITDLLGQYWEQPDTKEIRVFMKTAIMSERTLNKLHDYSRSQPSGVYPGKMWKTQDALSPSGWGLCWFSESKKGKDWCSNNYRKIILE